MTHEHDYKENKPTAGQPPAEVEAGLADPAPEGLDALAPTILRLPGREPIDVTGLGVGDVIDMIRDACHAADQPDPNAPVVNADPTPETQENLNGGASEAPSESSEEPLITDVTTPGGWIIIGCGDEKGEHGFIVEGTVRPSDRGRRRGRRTAAGKKPTAQKPGP